MKKVVRWESGLNGLGGRDEGSGTSCIHTGLRWNAIPTEGQSMDEGRNRMGRVENSQLSLYVNVCWRPACRGA